MVQQIIFILITVIAFSTAFYQFYKIRKKILLGKDEELLGDSKKRWKNVLLIALGQKKMFKRIIPAVLHLFIYAAFLLTQIELIEIFIDGIFSQHRFFSYYLGGFYTFIIGFIEILSVLAFVSTVVFLIRRNIIKVPRLHKPEMKGWPTKDANLILLLEIFLLIGIFSMNGADTVLQGIDGAHYPSTGSLPVSSWLGPWLFGGFEYGTLVLVERFGWWLHILVVYAFMNYLPISKHLHIFLAFPNTYFSKLEGKGKMENMPEIMKEVKSMMDPEATFDEADMSEELPEFGANDIMSLSWQNIMAAYTCTECGRCTDNCPANITGKKLSPRKIMMDVRGRADEIGLNIDKNIISLIDETKRGEGVDLCKANYNDGKSLFDSISKEEIHACTTCNACVEACPVLINPLDIILKLRRYEILTLSEGPSEWVPMFTSIENSGSCWQIPGERDEWKNQLLN